ncbi:MAG: ATP-binding cassette domain-containing protein [Spirochaetales bacterium]|nr:ATP-binding cassette domain-containing protein [Spirochaetales bacterium]
MELTTHHLVVHQGKTPVLKNLSFSLPAGHSLVIRGTNGCGKTTLLRSLLGLLPVSHGEIRLNHMIIGSPEWLKIRHKMAWVPQEGILHRFPISALEVVTIGTAGRKLRAKHRKDIVFSALESVEALHLQQRCYHRLSGGERQRISLARCLAQGAEILLLDEPGTGLDQESRHRLSNLLLQLNKQGVSLLAVTHDQELFSNQSWETRVLKEGQLC